MKQKDRVRWKVQFRLEPGGPPTAERFDSYDEAVRFGRLVDRIGGKAAREVRNASDAADLDVPTLRTFFDDHLTEVAAARTPGTVAEYRRVAERTWMPTLGDLPVN